MTLARLSVSHRNHGLRQIHSALRGSKQLILEANAKDRALAAEAAQNGQLSQSLVERLDLGKKGKFEDMLQGILDVVGLDDPGLRCLICFLWLSMLMA